MFTSAEVNADAELLQRLGTTPEDLPALIQQYRQHLLVVQTLMRGPSDLAEAVLGPERMCLAMYEAPGELARFLEERHVRVTTYAPRFWSLSFTLKRLLFNMRIASRLRAACHDWVVGFDLDGFHYGRRPTAPYVASIKGVIVDELKNERGVVRLMLGSQAAFERAAVRRARVVVATSRYSRDRRYSPWGWFAEHNPAFQSARWHPL